MAFRGHFHVCNKELGPFTAHISSKACEKVWNIAKKLPAVLQMTKLSRLDSWPKSFKTSPPNDESIALYFFAQDARYRHFTDVAPLSMRTNSSCNCVSEWGQCLMNYYVRSLKRILS